MTRPLFCCRQFPPFFFNHILLFTLNLKHILYLFLSLTYSLFFFPSLSLSLSFSLSPLALYLYPPPPPPPIFMSLFLTIVLPQSLSFSQISFSLWLSCSSILWHSTHSVFETVAISLPPLLFISLYCFIALLCTHDPMYLRCFQTLIVGFLSHMCISLSASLHLVRCLSSLFTYINSSLFSCT